MRCNSRFFSAITLGIGLAIWLKRGARAGIGRGRRHDRSRPDIFRRAHHVVTDNALTLAMAEALEGDGGVRMTGGRFGGCVVAVCPAERRERLEVALRGHWARTGAVSPLQAVVAPSQAAQFL